MKKIILILVLVLAPIISYGAVANDFKVNPQPTYAIPPGTNQVLILDLTLPEPVRGGIEQLKSIKINNSGTALQTDISRITIFEDGPSSGWDGDEREVVNVFSSPFFDTPISGNFTAYRYPSGINPWQSLVNPWQRIFITVDIASGIGSGRTIKPQLLAGPVESASVQFVLSTSTMAGPTDANVIGFERTILVGVSFPTAPLSPLPKNPEAISVSAIRWHFLDLSNNEFGFKILDSSLRTLVKKEEADLSYLDETGLEPNTNYSGRRIYAFNDRGESSASAVFPAVYTLAPTPNSIEKLEMSTTSVKVRIADIPPNLTIDSTGIYFENITAGTNSDWIKSDNWISSGLAPGREYELRAKTRNGDGVETGWSSVVRFATRSEELPPVKEVAKPPAEKPILEMTTEELQTKIAEILEKINQLKSQLLELQKTEEVIFKTDLKYGDRGDDVISLQSVLIREGLLAAGLNTGWFGPQTRAAVIKFQEKYRQDILTPLELTSGTGFVGVKTRAKLNEVFYWKK